MSLPLFTESKNIVISLLYLEANMRYMCCIVVKYDFIATASQLERPSFFNSMGIFIPKLICILMNTPIHGEKNDLSPNSVVSCTRDF